MLINTFFSNDPATVAKNLLGKVLRRQFNGIYLSAMIIETESYYLNDKGSHASLGFTEKRKALFMPAGTIYMYYARGGDSLNVSCQGEGNAVLIKSAIPFLENSDDKMLAIMQQLNPHKNKKQPRTLKELCCGQTLLCKSLNLKVPEWDQKQFIDKEFFIEDVSYKPKKIIQTARLGIPKGRDEHLPYRFIDFNYATSCTDNPLTKRGETKSSIHFVDTDLICED